MIVFKKLKIKRINPFKVLDDESEAPAKDDESLAEIKKSDWKQEPVNKKRTSDATIFGSGIDDSISIPKKKRNTDVLGDVMLDISPTREWNQCVNTATATAAASAAATENDCHTPSPILPTNEKKYPQRRCVYCRVNSTPRDTRYCIYTPALCKTPCFAKYHCSGEALAGIR